MTLEEFRDRIVSQLDGQTGPFALDVYLLETKNEVAVSVSLTEVQGFAPANTDEQNAANADAFVKGFLAQLRGRP